VQCSRGSLTESISVANPKLWGSEKKMSKRSIIVPVVTLGIAALLLFTINGCWNSWEGRTGEQRTDDA
jgi:hypothetical protein